MRFVDKVVIVTGGANGIGETTCESFAKEGAKVVIADIDDAGKDVSERLNQMGYDTLFVKCNIAEEAEIIGLIEQAVQKYGKLNVFCANAGITLHKMPLDQNIDDFDRLININARAIYFCNKYATAQFIKQGTKGSIVNTSSAASLTVRPAVSAYSVSKGANNVVAKAFTKAYASLGIRYNTVCPGGVSTKMIAELMAAQPKELTDAALALHPIGRWGETQEVANAILFLASDDASYITGATLTVDGGFSV